VLPEALHTCRRWNAGNFTLQGRATTTLIPILSHLPHHLSRACATMTDKETAYEYLKITQPGIIRLILLQPSDIEAELHCSLVDASLKDCDNDVVEHYVALSYVWGDANQKGSISIDGKLLEITASLEMSLRHVRDRSRVLRIWADGICINQKDLDDRNTQVGVMGSIYATARHTIIFLSLSNPKHESVLQKIADLGTSYEIEHNRESIIGLADDMLAYAWFTRVWILQELVLSPDPWVQVGRVRMRWDLFLQCMVVKYAEPQSTRQQLLRSMAQIRTKYQVRRHSGAEQDDLGATILDILKARRGLGVLDPRDMVYAHLGMSEPSVRSNINIDYSKSKAQVYEDISRYILSISRDLSILSLIEDVDLESRPHLPSWVPDWSVRLGFDQVPARKAMVAVDPAPEPDTFSNLFMVCDAPGVLAFAGRRHGTVVHVLSQTLLPSCKDSSYTIEQIVEWMYKPEALETIEVLLTCLPCLRVPDYITRSVERPHVFIGSKPVRKYYHEANSSQLVLKKTITIPGLRSQRMSSSNQC
jgi:hypothetical protein